MPDAHLVAAVLAGDREAYGELVGRHARRVYSVLLRMVGNPEDAEDLAQETFVRAYLALAGFDPRYRFAAWINQIAANLAFNLTRSRSRIVTLDGDEATEALFEMIPDRDLEALPSEASEARDLSDGLRLAVQSLPPDFRQILLMRHVMELSYQEICDATGLPMGTVKSRLDRARRLLAERIQGLV